MRRGEAWIARLNPNRGREIGKTRPVVVMRANELLTVEEATIIVLPLTTQVYPALQVWRIPLPRPGLFAKGLPGGD